MEAAQARVQDAVNKHTQDFEKNFIRKIEGDTYRCHATCCDNMTYGMEDKNNCIERCSQNMLRIQQFVQNEMNSFQNRLQRCAENCNDQARDKMSGVSSALEQGKVQSQLEGCVIKCADSHVDLLIPLFKRLKDCVSKHKFS